MLRFRSFAYYLGVRIHTLMAVLRDAICFLVLCLRPAPALAAENLFLRKQLAQYQERQIKPRRANDATRIALVWLSWLFDWRRALQPGPTPYVPGTRYSAADTNIASTPTSPSTPDANGAIYRGSTGYRRLTPRLWARKAGGMRRLRIMLM